MDQNRLVRRTFYAYVQGDLAVPEGSLLMDCGTTSLEVLVQVAKVRKQWGVPAKELT